MTRYFGDTKLVATLFTVATALAACATYDGLSVSGAQGGAAGTPTLGGADAGGADAGGAPQTAGSGGSLASGGDGQSGGGSGGEIAGSTAIAGGGGSAASMGGGGASSGGNGGLGGGGTAGATAGSGGGAGAPIVDTLISQGKTTTADSEQTGNDRAFGNDGSLTTRWCAADGAAGHYWQVDLGRSFTLGKIQINWEKAALYQFKVEGSQDGNVWVGMLDQTMSTNATANQSYTLPTAPSARLVRITTTSLPASNVWASFFEFQVYGH
jgi:hypothetical protein